MHRLTSRHTFASILATASLDSPLLLAYIPRTHGDLYQRKELIVYRDSHSPRCISSLHRNRKIKLSAKNSHA